MAKVELSPALLKLTKGQSVAVVQDGTLKEIIQELENQYPGIKSRLLTDNQQIQRYVSIFVGEEDVRYLNGLDTKVGTSETISILIALAGG